jgi:hypothetical protein
VLLEIEKLKNDRKLMVPPAGKKDIPLKGNAESLGGWPNF